MTITMSMYSLQYHNNNTEINKNNNNNNNNNSTNSQSNVSNDRQNNTIITNFYQSKQNVTIEQKLLYWRQSNECSKLFKQ